MEEDPLKAYADASGINGRVFEALLQGGDLRSLIWGILPQMTGMLPEMNPDSPLATVMRLILANNGMPLFGTTGQNEGNGQLAAVATLRRVAGMLGACSTCCGEESSCPACHGSGGPGCFPSIASAEELGAWLGPVLDRMGMHIMHRVTPDDSPQ
jgi:hypothetical protein